MISRPVDIQCFLPLIVKRCSVDTIDCIPTWQKALLRPDCERIVQINESLVSRFNTQNGHRGLFHEFEIRIGKITEQHFASSVRPSHYKWLGQTLESMNVPYIYKECIDVFENNNTRTSYGTTICCIKKQRQDLKNIHTADIFGYDTRLAVSTEEYMSRNADTCHITDPNEHIKMPCVVSYRTK